MSFNHQEPTDEISENDSPMSETSEYTVENCFVDSIAREVQKKIKRKDLDEDERWNIIVMQHFDDAFESVSMIKVWRRFLLTLYGKELPINEQMIDNIIGNKLGYNSAVLDSVLEYGTGVTWEHGDDSDDETGSNQSDETDNVEPSGDEDNSDDSTENY